MSDPKAVRITPEMLRRHGAAKNTLERFRRRRFDWAKGHTCAHLALFHLKQMGRKVPKVPAFRSPLGAARALKAMGCENVAQVLDRHLERIAPARMMIGDLAVAGSVDGLGAIMVCVGHLKLIGWREDADRMVVLDVRLDELDAAWRV